MITSKDYDGWRELADADPVAAVRALADYAGDLVTLVRVVAGVKGLTRLADGAPDGTLHHAERLYAGLVTRVTTGRGNTGATPDVLTRWTTDAVADRDKVLRTLADQFGQLLYVLNVVGDDLPGRDLAWSEEGKPYWHAERAHTAVLTVLTGNAEDGRRLHDLWSDCQEDTAWNLKTLAEQKRAESVIVTVAADGNTAKVVLPGGLDCDAGRVAETGLFWVADEVGDVIGHDPAWPGIGRKLADHYRYPDNTVVLVEYAAQAQG